MKKSNKGLAEYLEGMWNSKPIKKETHMWTLTVYISVIE